MKLFLPSLVLGACLSTPAYAELTRISISGIVTSASISSGEFSGMRVGDTWTFEMLIERTPQLALSNVADLSFSDSFHLTVDQTIGGVTSSRRHSRRGRGVSRSLSMIW